MSNRLIAGNWKMNTSRNEALKLATEIGSLEVTDSTDVALFPPFVWLEAVSRILAESQVAVGAQDCSAEQHGAFTGQVSATMLRELCSWVIVGHSERRRDAAESNELVGRKAAAAYAAGLQPIICVGESLETREQGEAEQFVGHQLEAAIAAIEDHAAADVVIAYEPIWAIGTGVSASAVDAQHMACFIRKRVESRVKGSLRVLYGGSVVPDNAGAFLNERDVDGLLVGGASLKAEQFREIILSC